MAAEEDRPFKAEYAKSSRAGCKQCKGAITKDTLRLAKMVQSPFFDGKQPNWYHFSCFFKNSIIHSESEVSGFGSIRWEDQEKIRKKISGDGGSDATDGGGGGGGGKGTKSKKRKTTRSDLQVEYAKSSRSTCKGCNSQITKSEVRIAKMRDPDPDETSFGGQIPMWHHVDCFVENIADLDAEGVSAEELSGFTKLKKDDKDELKMKFSAASGPTEDVDGGAAKGRGKKRKTKEEEPPPSKKTKKESAEEKALREQSQLMWKIRDELKENLSKSALKMLLMANKQTVPSGESGQLDRCADGMLFGALSPCPTCSGQLTARSHCYQCTGNISAWSKCTYTTDDPGRGVWVIPDELKEIPCLSKFKFKSRKRIFQKECTPPAQTPSVAMDTTDSPGPSQPSSSGRSVAKVDSPLHGFTIFIIGRLDKSKPMLTKQIDSLGGRVVSKVTDNTTICISNENELEKMSKKMIEVEDADVPVVSIDFLEDASKGAALLKIPTHTISEWGAPRHSLPADETDYFGGGKSFKSTGPSKVKVRVKGAAAVDPESELEDSHHVLEDEGIIWNAVLGMADITRGTNSYYKLQLLESDGGFKQYCVFRSWGRVGTTIGGNKLDTYGSHKSAAKISFETLYQEKTGNYWRSKGKPVKQPGKFYPLEIDYGPEEEVAHLGKTVGSKSKLAPETQELIKMIFDVESMKKAMLEFEIDMKKMPLGKLSKRQIQNAYSVLTELQREISGAKNPALILDASNRFYTLIPHDFGLRKPPLLDNEELIRTKTMMLDNLLEIEVAYSLLKDEGGKGEGKDPLDKHYKQLKTDMEVLPKDSDEFKMLAQYVANTHGATHTQYKLKVREVFKVVRHDEDKRFKPFSKLHNRQLLWHGSRTTNYVGILSQGLRIAPPEAPVTGYMFGKGVYFADMVTKSANYCWTSRSNNTGLMLLCEVALGDMYELTHSEFVTSLPGGKLSTKGLGRTAPDPKGARTTDSGACIPMGKAKNTTVAHTSLLYNEYIVYDVSQISMKYLLKMEFDYK